MSKKQGNVVADEQGLASIIVTMVMMIVISLLVVGFVKLSDRQQRQSLDNQLATQAYYAAESGINDVVSYVQTASVATAKTTCGDPGATNPGYTDWHPFYTQYQNTFGSVPGNSSVANTCILVDTEPGILTNTFKTVGQSWVVPLTTSTGNAIKSLTFSVTAGGAVNLGTCNFDFSGGHLPATSSCGYPALRFDLVPIDGSANTPDNLLKDTMSGLAVPINGGTGDTNFISNSTAGAADVYPFNCSGVKCTLEIDEQGGGDPLPTTDQFYLRVMPLYSGNATLQITGKDSTNANISWTGAQILVDSTAKAQDQIKRLQAAVPINQAAKVPDYGVQTTQSLCKYFTIVPPNGLPQFGSPSCPAF